MAVERILLDRGTGRELQRRGLVKRGSIESALARIERPEVVREVHEEFIAAGADIITTSNYGVVPSLLAKEGMESRLAELRPMADRRRRRTRGGAVGQKPVYTAYTRYITA